MCDGMVPWLNFWVEKDRRLGSTVDSGSTMSRTGLRSTVYVVATSTLHPSDAHKFRCGEETGTDEAFCGSHGGCVGGWFRVG